MESISVHNTAQYKLTARNTCGRRMETMSHLLLFVAIDTHVYPFKWKHHLAATETFKHHQYRFIFFIFFIGQWQLEREKQTSLRPVPPHTAKCGKSRGARHADDLEAMWASSLSEALLAGKHGLLRRGLQSTHFLSVPRETTACGKGVTSYPWKESQSFIQREKKHSKLRLLEVGNTFAEIHPKLELKSLKIPRAQFELKHDFTGQTLLEVTHVQYICSKASGNW